MKNPIIPGFILITALFILVILGLAGTGLVKMKIWQQQSLSYDWLSKQAYYAAKSGLVLARSQWEQGKQCLDQNYSFEEGSQSLQGYRVFVSCKLDPENHILFESVAMHGEFGSPDYAFATTKHIASLRGT